MTTFDCQLLQAILRTDLMAFVAKAFSTVSPYQPFVPNWHLEAICYRLSQVARGEICRLVITVPPRSLKSTIVSVAFPAWLLGHRPEKRIIAVSYGQDLSNLFSRDTRAVMQSDWYRDVFPATRLDPKKQGEQELLTTRRGGRLATSISGVLTGRGGDVIIIDDPLKPSDAHSEVRRAEVIQWYSNTLVSRLNDKRTGAIVLVMQRLHEEDLAGHLLEQGGWVHLNLPAIAEETERIAIGRNRYHVRTADELLFPQREPLETVEQLRRDLGTYDFSAQYQQRPIPKEGLIIRAAWFDTYEHLPAKPEFILQSWDTATKVGELNDFSVGTIWYVSSDGFYLADVIREKLEFPQLRHRIVTEARKHRSPTVLIENSAAGPALVQDLRHESIDIISVKPTGDKTMRYAACRQCLRPGGSSYPRVRRGKTHMWPSCVAFREADTTIRSTAQRRRLTGMRTAP